ncbi:MAG: YceD family protein [Polaribacter sp.]
MKDLKQFNIQFVGLKEGNHLFEYQIDNTFFEAFNYNEFFHSSIKVDVNFVKKSTLFELTFAIHGIVNIPCDTTNEPFDQPIEADLFLAVKSGPVFNDDNDEILMLPHEAYQLNIAQYIYEMTVLAIPTKRIHPKVLDGTMQSEALKKLKELEIQKENKVEKTDPRWDKLKNLITEKNT